MIYLSMMYRLEQFFDWLSDWAERMRMRCSYCCDCGRNRYTGAACKGEVEQ